jgi:hypothetical protein
MKKVAEARETLVGGHKCLQCGILMSTRRHKCKPKPEKTDLVTFAVGHSIELMSKKWHVSPDMTTRIRTENDSLPLVRASDERSKFSLGWASRPDRRTMSEKLKSYLRDVAGKYYDEKKVLKSHKAMQMLYTEVDDNGLPKFMPDELPSHSSCNTFLQKYEKTHIESRLRRRLVEQCDVDKLLLQQTLYGLMSKKQLQAEWKRLFGSTTSRAVDPLRNALVRNLKYYGTKEKRKCDVTKGGPTVVRWHSTNYLDIEAIRPDDQWSEMKVSQLKEYCTRNNIRLSSNQSKGDILTIIRNYHAKQAEASVRQEARDASVGGVVVGDEPYDDEACAEQEMLDMLEHLDGSDDEEVTLDVDE